MYRLISEFDAAKLPVSVTERYRTADGPTLKVAFWLLLKNACNPEQISDELSIPLATVERALKFWESAGLITSSDEKAEKPVTAVKERPRIPFSEISKISLRNPEIASLFQETQRCLGRPISDDESSRLMALYKYDGLSVDIILMIVEYAKCRAKRSVMSYIERVARDWLAEGVDGIDKAEKHLKLLEMREKREQAVADALGVERGSFKLRDRQRIASWYEDYGYNIRFVEEAQLRCNEEQQSSVGYIHSILTNWHGEGIRSVKETRTAPSNAPVKSGKGKAAKEIDSFAKRATRKLLGVKENEH